MLEDKIFSGSKFQHKPFIKDYKALNFLDRTAFQNCILNSKALKFLLSSAFNSCLRFYFTFHSEDSRRGNRQESFTNLPSRFSFSLVDNKKLKEMLITFSLDKHS